MNKKKILIVAAHPDDEVLGCGGTTSRFINEGCEVNTIILGEGATSRYGQSQKAEKEKGRLREDVYEANNIIGVKNISLFDLPDNRFDTIALLDIVRMLEKVKNEIRPDIVYTHHRGDLNMDHRITYNAVLTACRPVKGEAVKEIYSFETASSTEWNYPYTFSPNIFVDISETMDKKIEALKIYETELREFPHPRSEYAIRAAAARWGSLAGLDCAEAFEAIRIIE